MKTKMQRNVLSFSISILLIMVLFGGFYFKTVSAASKSPQISNKEITLTIGMTKTLTVQNTTKKPKWYSNKPNIATVTQKGVVSAKSEGIAKITGKIGKTNYTCKVIVQNAKPTPTVPPVAEPTLRPTPIPDADWSIDKLSGTKEAFDKYFNLNLADYVKTITPHGTINKITYKSKVIGEKREAYVYLPAGYSKNKKYPVVYMIHGIGCDGGQWIYMSVNNILSNMIANGEVPPFIAVFPSVVPPVDKRTPGDSRSANNIKAFTDFKNEFTKDLEPYIRKNYSVSTNRKDTAVCGLSMGGMEALTLGFSMLDHFNYIGAFSPAPTLDTSLLTLSGSKYTPQLVMISSGDSDKMIGDVPKGYHDSLTKNGVDHIWFQFPGGNHEEKVWKNGLINFLQRIFRN